MKLIGNLIPYGDAYTIPLTQNTHKVQRIELNSHKEHDKWLKAQFNKCVSARTRKRKNESKFRVAAWCTFHFSRIYIVPYGCVRTYLPYAMLFHHALKFLLSIFVLLMLTHSHSHSYSQRLMHNNEKLCADQIRKQKSTNKRVGERESEKKREKKRNRMILKMKRSLVLASFRAMLMNASCSSFVGLQKHFRLIYEKNAMNK